MKTGKTSYFVDKNAKAIQADILQYGPVEAGFDVYEDFLHYKSGKFQYVSVKYLVILSGVIYT